MAPSSSGLGHHPLKVEARVRTPLGLPNDPRPVRGSSRVTGAVGACGAEGPHALLMGGGHGFEPGWGCQTTLAQCEGRLASRVRSAPAAPKDPTLCSWVADTGSNPVG